MYKKRHFPAPQPASCSRGLFLLVGLILLASASLFGCTPPNAAVSSPPATSVPPTSTTAPSATPVPPTGTPLPPTLVPTPSYCARTSGTLQRSELDTALLPKPLRYVVYLPPCYAQETQKRYPVLYMLHGQDDDENQWLRLGIASTADRLIASGTTPPFIIVLPFDYSSLQPSQYKFEQAFTQVLIPQIDISYRALPDRAHRAIGGLSRGGGWAIYLGARHPDLFGAIGAHSPGIFYSSADALPVWFEAIPKDELPRIFIDIGDNDTLLKSTESFEAMLTQLDIPHDWHVYNGFHDETYWSAHVEEYLLWYAAGWK